MSARAWAGLAAALYLIGLLVLFGYRSIRHRQKTGDVGFRGFSDPDPLVRASGALFVAAIVVGLTALLLTAAGVVPSPTIAGNSSVLAVPGLVIALVALAITWAAQTAMGTSWRIGVDEDETTALVTGGIFGQVRNPIFTAMMGAQAGTVLMAPSWLSIIGLAALIVGCEMQVRLVEEPYLLSTHGGAYRAYARETGRFLPGIGRLRGDAALGGPSA